MNPSFCEFLFTIFHLFSVHHLFTTSAKNLVWAQRAMSLAPSDTFPIILPIAYPPNFEDKFSNLVLWPAVWFSKSVSFFSPKIFTLFFYFQISRQLIDCLSLPSNNIFLEVMLKLFNCYFQNLHPSKGRDLHQKMLHIARDDSHFVHIKNK